MEGKASGHPPGSTCLLNRTRLTWSTVIYITILWSETASVCGDREEEKALLKALIASPSGACAEPVLSSTWRWLIHSYSHSLCGPGRDLVIEEASVKMRSRLTVKHSYLLLSNCQPLKLKCSLHVNASPCICFDACFDRHGWRLPTVLNRVFTRSSKRPALARVGLFWIHLLDVCWTLHPIS